MDATVLDRFDSAGDLEEFLHRSFGVGERSSVSARAKPSYPEWISLGTHAAQLLCFSGRARRPHCRGLARPADEPSPSNRPCPYGGSALACISTGLGHGPASRHARRAGVRSPDWNTCPTSSCDPEGVGFFVTT